MSQAVWISIVWAPTAVAIVAIICATVVLYNKNY